MDQRARVWTALTALAVGAALAALATAAHTHRASGPVREMCALITQPHTPVPDQRCDDPGVGRWRLILD